MNAQEKMAAAMKRIQGAVNFEKIDRVPVVLGGISAPMLHVSGSFAPMMEDPFYPTDCLIKTYEEIGFPDGFQSFGFTPYLLSTLWLNPMAAIRSR